MDNQLEIVTGFAVGLAMTFAIIPWLIPKLRDKGIVGEDLNKPHKPKVVEMGGIAVVIGFFAGISAALVMDGVAN
ncbi:MAG: hypothetical protein OEM29_09000, partial [Thermoplasmata archaeon]|nr:hypothetical protein [Thermoplasmata archaeon]